LVFVAFLLTIFQVLRVFPLLYFFQETFSLFEFVFFKYKIFS